MASTGLMRTSERIAGGFRQAGAPRLVAQLWGTTTLADCLVASRYLADPRQLIQGPAIVEYEQAFARQIGVRYAYSFGSGRVALYGLLRGLGVGPGDEVLLQAPTHIVVPNAIRYAGGRPVYVDCELDTYNMDLKQAEQQIRPGTKVLLLQHTFGIPADMDAALALAHRHGLIVVEDCVHALGAAYNRQQVGSFGLASFFSTEETKTISSTMGGMAVTDDPELAAWLRQFQSNCAWPAASLTARRLLKLVIYHLFTQPYLHHYTRPIYMFLRRSPWTHLAPGATASEEQRGVRPANYEQRLSNAQAALALRQLRRLETNLAHRRTVADAYRTQLLEQGFDVPHPPAKAEAAFVRYPVWVEDRAATMRIAAPHAVLGRWFTSVLEEAVSPACGDYQPGSCPRAEAAARHLVNLPTHLRVNERDIKAIVSAVASAASAVSK